MVLPIGENLQARAGGWWCCFFFAFSSFFVFSNTQFCVQILCDLRSTNPKGEKLRTLNRELPKEDLSVRFAMPTAVNLSVPCYISSTVIVMNEWAMRIFRLAILLRTLAVQAITWAQSDKDRMNEDADETFAQAKISKVILPFELVPDCLPRGTWDPRW